MPEPNISTCWDVAIFCPLVVFVGGVRSWLVFVAGVRVVEFGSMGMCQEKGGRADKRKDG